MKIKIPLKIKLSGQNYELVNFCSYKILTLLTKKKIES